MEISDLIEVRLKDDESFLKIKETLTRIGVTAKHEKRLYQSCHILHKRGKYYIVHFKQLFALDGKDSNIQADDIDRLKRIVILLEDWDLLDIVDESQVENPAPMNQLKVIRHSEKGEWELIPKYNIGVRK